MAGKRQRNQRVKQFKYFVLNMKLTSRKPVTEKSYRDLFETAFTRKSIGQIRGSTSGIIRQLFWNKETHFGHGLLCSFIKNEGQAMDIEKLEIVDFQIDKNLFLNPKEANFIFFPGLHRIGILASSKITLNSIKIMLEKIFLQVIDSDESVEIIIEQSADIFDKILKAKQISKLHVEISPSNADISKATIEFMDKELKNMGAQKMATDITSNDSGKLNIEKSGYLQELLGMARSNGYAKATIINNDDKREIVVTDKHPEVFPITASTEDGAKPLLYNNLMKRFRQ